MRACVSCHEAVATGMTRCPYCGNATVETATLATTYVPTSPDQTQRQLAKLSATVDAGFDQVAAPSGSMMSPTNGVRASTALGAREEPDLNIEWRVKGAGLDNAEIQTVLWHLATPDHPIVELHVTNRSQTRRRFSCSAVFSEITETASADVDVPPRGVATVGLVPALRPRAVRTLQQKTPVSCTVEIQERDGQRHSTTKTAQLLPLSSISISPRTFRGLNALVTPNAEAIRAWLAEARTIGGADVTWSGLQSGPENVHAQVRALYRALQRRGLQYQSTTVQFATIVAQRINHPAAVLRDNAGNCIDLTLLIASALESLSIPAGIVLLPKHAILSYRTEGEASSERMDTSDHLLDGTLLPDNAWEKARDVGEHHRDAHRTYELDVSLSGADIHAHVRTGRYWRRGILPCPYLDA